MDSSEEATQGEDISDLSPPEFTEEGQTVVKVTENDSEEVEGDTPINVSSTEPQPIEQKEPERPSQNPEIAAWVESISINGANESRQFIIFNNTRYEREHFVNFTLGVQFLGIRGRNIYFQDTRGAIYIKEF